MESRKIDLLSFGSDASDVTFFGSGDGFFESMPGKSFASEEHNILNSVATLAGFDSPTWMFDASNTVDNLFYNVNNLDTNSLFEVDNTYSLDDILDGKQVLSPLESRISLESPLGSPLSSGDEMSYDLDDLLATASPEEVLASKMESSPVPLAEHMYAAALPDIATDNSMDEFINPSIDSELPSSDESSVGEDILMQLLNGDFDNTAVIQAVEPEADSNPTGLSTIGTNIFHVNSDAAEDQQNAEKDSEEVFSKKPSQSRKAVTKVEMDGIRFAPYKAKQKTKEQKQRKKAQNRDAAIRYRNKKKEEVGDMDGEADELEKKNKELKDKVGGLKKEVDYLKNLMLDIIKARLANGKQNAGLDAAVSNTLMNMS